MQSRNRTNVEIRGNAHMAWQARQQGTRIETLGGTYGDREFESQEPERGKGALDCRA